MKVITIRPGDTLYQLGREYGLTVDEVIRDVFAKTNVPVIAGLQAGHMKEKLTLCLGRRYRMDADNGTVTLID